MNEVDRTPGSVRWQHIYESGTRVARAEAEAKIERLREALEIASKDKWATLATRRAARAALNG